MSAAIAALVEELGWLNSLITIPGAGIDADGKRIPPKERGRAKKRLMSVRALEALKAWRDAA